MKYYNIIIILLTLFSSFPMLVEASNDISDRYSMPDSIVTNLEIKSNTKNSVTFRLEVKSAIGTIRNVSLSAKVVGFNKVMAIPSEAYFDEIKEGETRYLDFILPTTKEIANSNAFEITGIIEYIPDYKSILLYVDKNAESLYEDEFLRDFLKHDITECDKESFKSVETTTYFPPEN